jgi:hypothetical protein
MDHVQIMLFDQTVQVDIEKVQSGRRAPMAEQAWLDVSQLERDFEERVLLQVNLTNGEVVGRAPIGIHPLEEFR